MVQHCLQADMHADLTTFVGPGKLDEAMGGCGRTTLCCCHGRGSQAVEGKAPLSQGKLGGWQEGLCSGLPPPGGDQKRPGRHPEGRGGHVHYMPTVA